VTPGPERFIFAVVGHDEAATLAGVLEQAFAAAQPSDDVWFVDSASSDDSARIAATLGAKVVKAPLGKGRAIAAAVERSNGSSLCFVDADIEYSKENIPLLLRQAAASTGADMVIGEVDELVRRRSTMIVAWPLLARLFPEALEIPLRQPLSGFRVLRGGVEVGELPPGYGVETHLNLRFALNRSRVVTCPLGAHRGPLRGYANAPAMAMDVAAAILDLAEFHGRLDPHERPRWDEWVEPAVDLIRGQPPPGADDAEYRRRLTEMAARPLPAAR
jgi:glucosyl-3-phosphoglycerate synthase